MPYQEPDSSRLVHHMARLSYLADLMAHRRILLIGNEFEFAQFISEARARHVIAVSDRSSELRWPERSSTPGMEFQSMDLNEELKLINIDHDREEVKRYLESRLASLVSSEILPNV